jgi:hypothetical protein
MIGWVFFRSKDIFQAVEYVKQMFSFVNYQNSVLTYLSMKSIIALVVGIALCGPIQSKLQVKYNTIKYNKSVIISDYCVQYVLLIICILELIGGTYNPFIYFQF